MTEIKKSSPCSGQRAQPASRRSKKPAETMTTGTATSMLQCYRSPRGLAANMTFLVGFRSIWTGLCIPFTKEARDIIPAAYRQ